MRGIRAFCKAHLTGKKMGGKKIFPFPIFLPQIFLPEMFGDYLVGSTGRIYPDFALSLHPFRFNERSCLHRAPLFNLNAAPLSVIKGSVRLLPCRAQRRLLRAATNG